ncbi:prenyltransferase/squalene oxidase repeat-containing protein [Desulfotruncus alcoholivorax]|uniref:prenyltransferase/squalene oxidase repeat-containing protein n=1 Tax=Desulfotruncus alcoholivorax TaxID=265477 RepID=UPI0004175A62|nr:prenyltransferase/squalene oxidase repeat-containing protein [Desulfotruncus alcoholivorax]
MTGIKKIISALVVLFVMNFALSATPACAGANAGGAAAGHARVAEAIKGAEQYLVKKMSAPQYDGMLEWAMLGLYADNKNVQSFSLKREAQIARGVMIDANKNTDYQRSILGALAAGKNPDGYGGIKLLEKVWLSQTPRGKFADSINGQGDRLVNAHVWGIISLYAAGREIADADKALQWLVDHQNTDGGFSIDTNMEESDVDMTAMAVIALACLGKDTSYPAVQKALAYLKEQQNDDGTFGAWGTSTTESCAQVIQALVMLGIDPAGAEWSKEGKNAVTGLLKYRLPNGSFSHGPERLPNDMATAQALIALVDYSTGETVYTRLHQASKTQPFCLSGGKQPGGK